jgi:hypothetical protein
VQAAGGAQSAASCCGQCVTVSECAPACHTHIYSASASTSSFVSPTCSSSRQGDQNTGRQAGCNAYSLTQLCR